MYLLTFDHRFTFVLGLPSTISQPTISPIRQVIHLTTSNLIISLRCEANAELSYTWERQDGSIPSSVTGLNTNTLTFVNLQVEDAGQYRCVITGACGTSFSEYATIEIFGKCSTVTQKCDEKSLTICLPYKYLCISMHTKLSKNCILVKGI